MNAQIEYEISAMFAGGFDKSVTLQKTTAYEKMNGFFAGGGKNPGEQLLLWKMAGGDSFNGSMEGYEDIMANMREGLSSPTVRANFKKYLDGLSSDSQRRMALGSLAGLAPGKGREADLILQHVFGSGLDIDKDKDTIIANMEKAGVSNAGIQTIYSDYKGSTTRANALGSEGNYTRAGEMLGPKVQDLEGALIKVGGSFLDAVGKIHDVGSLFSESGKFIKDAVGKIWDSGPLGQMVTLLGGIYIGIKALAGASKMASLVEGLLGTSGAAAAGGTAARAGLLSRFAAAGPIAAGVTAAGYTMYGDLANVDEATLAKRAGGPRVDDDKRSGQHDLTNLLLQDIAILMRNGAVAAGGGSSAPAMGTTH